MRLPCCAFLLSILQCPIMCVNCCPVRDLDGRGESKKAGGFCVRSVCIMQCSNDNFCDTHVSHNTPLNAGIGLTGEQEDNDLVRRGEGRVMEGF